MVAADAARAELDGDLLSVDALNVDAIDASLRVSTVARQRVILATFTAASLLGSTLLFMVQPIIGRQLLPLAGGTPNLWNTAMVFFQAVLLAGYLYAHFSTTHLTRRTHALTQLIVLALPVLVLPISVPGGWNLVGDHPALTTLAVLALMVGLPFFALSTSSPTLQRWFSMTSHPAADDPYFLYAAGNVGSLSALVAYPLVIEPNLSLTQQSRLWAGAYVAFIALSAACATIVYRTPSRSTATAAGVAGQAVRATIAWSRRSRWVFWAFVPSALMLSVTRHLTADVASFPLLWIVPLVLYLLTFIIAFGANAQRLVGPINAATKFGAVALVVLFVAPVGGTGPQLAVHLGWFFLAALLGHLRLSTDRPGPAALTEFYAWISVGGVLGGAFIALAAPLLFDRVIEYPLVVAAALTMLVAGGQAVASKDQAQRQRKRGRRSILWPAPAAALALGLWLQSTGNDASAALIVGSAGAVVAVTVANPRLVAALLGGTALLATFVDAGSAIYRDRSFFGVYAVQQTGDGFHELFMGTTVHGRQRFVDGVGQNSPSSYYHPAGPLGDAFAALPPSAAVGVVGLGAGEIAAYGRPTDAVTFYEIDPLVVDIARDDQLFTFLRDTQAQVGVEVGDGRLALEATSERYDLLLIDAFSSDAIPVHLLTAEAVAVYADRLEDNGVLMLHVSNRFFDLRPVVGTIADELGLVARSYFYTPEAADQADGASSAIWMALASQPAALDTFGGAWKPAPSDGPLWTDDHANVLAALW